MNIIAAIRTFVSPKLDALSLTNLMRYGSAVRSVQRGVFSGTSSLNSSDGNLIITVASVNPAKCTVNITGSELHYPAVPPGGIRSGSSWCGHIMSLTAAQLGIRRGGRSWNDEFGTVYDFAGGSWEIIEYY